MILQENHLLPRILKKQIKYERYLFDFNHIDESIEEETKAELKKLYKYYHKLWWCHKKAVERLKKINLAINLTSVSLVTAGTIAGAVTANPIILGVITGAGLLIKTTSEIKQVTNKIAMFKIGLSTYEKTLVDLRSFLRGKEYSREDFIFKMNLVDGDIADLYTIPEKILKKYEKNFSMIFPVGKIIHLLHQDIHQNMKVGFEFLQSKLLLLHR